MSGFITADGFALIETDIVCWIRAGKGYTASTGGVYWGGGGAARVGLSLFNPAASGKGVLLHALSWFSGQYTTVDLLSVTTDPAYTNALPPVNSALGGPASALTGHVTCADTNQSTPGTEILVTNANAGVLTDVLTNGRVIHLPAGSSNGIVLLLGLGGNGSWGINASWIEI